MSMACTAMNDRRVDSEHDDNHRVCTPQHTVPHCSVGIARKPQTRRPCESIAKQAKPRRTRQIPSGHTREAWSLDDRTNIIKHNLSTRREKTRPRREAPKETHTNRVVQITTLHSGPRRVSHPSSRQLRGEAWSLQTQSLPKVMFPIPKRRSPARRTARIDSISEDDVSTRFVHYCCVHHEHLPSAWYGHPFRSMPPSTPMPPVCCVVGRNSKHPVNAAEK